MKVDQTIQKIKEAQSSVDRMSEYDSERELMLRWLSRKELETEFKKIKRALHEAETTLTRMQHLKVICKNLF